MAPSDLLTSRGNGAQLIARVAGSNTHTDTEAQYGEDELAHIRCKDPLTRYNGLGLVIVTNLTGGVAGRRARYAARDGVEQVEQVGRGG